MRKGAMLARCGLFWLSAPTGAGLGSTAGVRAIVQFLTQSETVALCTRTRWKGKWACITLIDHRVRVRDMVYYGAMSRPAGGLATAGGDGCGGGRWRASGRRLRLMLLRPLPLREHQSSPSYILILNPPSLSRPPRVPF